MIAHYLSGYFVPFMIILVAVGFILAVKYAASRYRKIPPGRVGIFYGRQFKWTDGTLRGYLVVAGGGRVQRPIVESYLEMATTAFQVRISEDGIPNKDNVKVVVGGVGTCKVSTDPADLNKAIEALLDKLTSERGSRENTLEEFVLNILKGHLRSIIGTLGIDDLLRNREEFNKKVMEESKTELKAFGIDLMNLVIQDIKDNEGYIEALGKRAVAETKAEAEIKVAQAQRQQKIEVSNAAKDAALVEAENAGRVAEANRDRDVRAAKAKTESETQRAAAEQAFAIANAAQEQKLGVAEADRDAATKEAQIKVQQKEAERREQELQATVVKQAEADKKSAIIRAEATKQTQILEAEATATVLRTTAEARKNATTLEGEGEANKQRSILVAQAEGKAAEKKQALLAEAEGTEKLAAALKDMDQAARFIIILDRLPALLNTGGDAAAKVAQAIFSSVAAPLGQIDSIQIVDMGGGAGNDGSSRGLNQLAGIVPQVVFEFLAKAKAAGLDVSKLLSVVGIDPAKAFAMLGNAESAQPKAEHTAGEVPGTASTSAITTS